jgi:hypothetical protein
MAENLKALNLKIQDFLFKKEEKINVENFLNSIVKTFIKIFFRI